MPWFFPWSESIKKRACRYLLQHYLGQFLKEKLTLDQLSVDLYNGTGTIHDVQLDVASLNEALENFNVPMEIVDGFIGKITVSIPWSALVSDSTCMQIHNLELTIQPKQRTDSPGVVMLDSMLASMTTSMELAQECLRLEPTEGEQIADNAQPFEGLESFAQTIEAVLAKVKVSLVDTIIRLEHLPKEAQTGAALEMRIERTEYFDDVAASQGTSVDRQSEGGHTIYEPAAIAHKNLHFMGVTLLCDEFPSSHRTYTRSCNSASNSTPAHTRGSESLSPGTSPRVSPDRPVLNLSENDDWKSAMDMRTKDSDPILIAVLTGKQELKLKLKQKDEIAGPKVEFNCQLGSANIHLSPRQVHLLLELAKGLSSPDLNDDSNMRSYRTTNKPMAHEDFEKVEQELQRELSSGRVQQRQMHGAQLSDSDHFISHSLDDLDEDETYYELCPSGAPSMDTSITSTTSSLSTAASSRMGHVVGYSKRQSGSPFQATIPPTARQNRLKPHKRKDHMHHYQDDPSAEVTRVRLKISFISVVILHEDPVSSGIDSNLDSTSKLREMASKFFSRVKGILPSGVGTEMSELRAEYSTACPFDHIGLLCKPITVESTQKTTSSLQSLCVEVTVGCAELVEVVFDRRNTTSSVRGFHLPIDNILPEYCLVLVFTEDDDDDDDAMGSSSRMYRSLQGAPTPCVRIHVETTERTQTSRQISSPSTTKINVELLPFETEVDITLVDRIQSLLNPQPLVQTSAPGPYSSVLRPPYVPSCQNRQRLFSEAIDEESVTEDRRLDLALSCPSASLILRFPIVDLRDGNNAERPWWQRCLHKERLTLKLTLARFETSFNTQEKMSKYEFTCREGQAFFQMTPNKPPVSFVYFGYREDEEGQARSEGFDWPQVVVKLYSHKHSVLEVEVSPDDSSDSNPLDSLNGACHFTKAEPSPFSSQKVLYDNQELVMPGDSQEMAEFQDKCLSETNISVEVTLPYVNAVIPYKDFIETLYNRLLNDLALWKPQAPAPLSSTDAHSLLAGAGWNQLLVQQMLQERELAGNSKSSVFQLCKSVIKDDDSSSDEESMFKTLTESNLKRKQISNKNTVSPSNMCVMLSIGKGFLTATAALKDDEGEIRSDKEGEVLLDLEDSCLLVTTGYGGDPSLQYMCIHSHKVALYHNGSVPIPEHPREVVGRGPHPATSDLHPTIYLSEEGVITKLSGQVGCTGSSMDMLSIAMKGKLDTFRNVKDIQLAVGLRGSTLHHRVVPSELNWLTQIMDIFDLKDYPVLGYTLPKVVTELHLHTWSCAIDYRPLYLPLRAMVTLEGFSISSNIIADSPTSLLRFVVDDGALFLSDRKKAPCVDLKKDYVCVMDVGLFELSLRSSDGRDPRYPKTDLRASNNILHLRTCADSCRALGELITYIVGDKDIHGAEKPAPKMSRTASCTSVESEEAMTQSSLELVSDEMAEAMRESSSSSSSNSSGANNPTQVFFFPDDKAQVTIGGSPHRTQTSLTSELEESVTGLAGLSLEDSATELAMAASINDVADGVAKETDSPDSLDDDFCFINDPGIGIKPKDGEPIVSVLSSGMIDVKENHFELPKGKFDQLRAPEHFPCPVYRYMLSEMSLVWYMYGGRDFRSSPPSKFKPSSPKYRGRRPHHAGSSKVLWLAQGGALRNHEVLMELQLNKVRLQYELYAETKEQVSWQIGLIQEVELRDRLTSSNINKFLYQYTSDALPKQTHANMVLVKAVHIRPDHNSSAQECSLKVSLQPLRLNIDQDALFFLRTFFAEISNENLSASMEDDGVVGGARGGKGSLDTMAPPPVMSLGGQTPSCQEQAQEHLLLFDEIEGNLNEGMEDEEHATEAGQVQPVYIKSFIFSPDVPIRLDYHGKRVDMDQGTLAGLLMGLGQLNCLELKLKKLHYRHGLLGTGKLLQHVGREWYQDIIKNQLPNILGGVGPMNSLIQLVRGVKDLFWLPVDQYKKDGRIVRGMQRGANSFFTLTTMSLLELTNKLVGTVQSAAEVTYDMVSPGPSVRTRTHKRHHRRLIHPGDLREGMGNAYTIVKEGFKGTAHNLYIVAKTEHEQKGMTGAVGGVLRQIPPSVVDPIIITAAATSNVLGGMRNQLLPDRKREDDEKWKAEIIDGDSL